MSDDPSAEPLQRRSRVPLVRTLVLLVLLLAIGSIFLGVVMPYQRQMSLIEHIEALGGDVWAEPIGPRWFRTVIGKHRMKGFEDVKYLYLGGPDTDSTILERVSAFPALSGVDLSESTISDEGLKHLLTIPDLKEVSLRGAHVTDAALVYLSQCPTLERLYLTRTDVSDEGLQHLMSLPHLKRLNLGDTNVSEAGIKELQMRLPACRIDWWPKNEPSGTK